MHFGLSFLPDACPQTKLPTAYFSEALALADMAEVAGFSFIKMTQHYLHPYGGYCPDPVTFLAAVAARTQRIRLMTGCLLPAFQHPLHLAAHTAMLDALSHGRAEIGFARAYLPYEFTAFGIPIDESRERFASAIEAVIQLWTRSPVTRESPFYRFADAISYPPVTQKPHPPIWGAAVNARQSFAWLGEQGFDLLVTASGTLTTLRERLMIYRESYREAGHEKKRLPRIAISMPTLIRSTDEHACRWGDHYLQKFINVWANAAADWSYIRSTSYPGYAGLAHMIQRNTPAVMRDQRQVLVGSPATVIDNINFMHQLLGVDHFLLQIEFGAQPFASAMQTLMLFIEEVMPKLRMERGTAQ